jgi:hypothetical protein
MHWFAAGSQFSYHYAVVSSGGLDIAALFAAGSLCLLDPVTKLLHEINVFL